MRGMLLQGRAASTVQAGSNGGIKSKVGSEDVRFAAEGKFLSGHLYVSDGIIHGLPSAAKEVGLRYPLHLTPKTQLFAMCCSFPILDRLKQY